MRRQEPSVCLCVWAFCVFVLRDAKSTRDKTGGRVHDYDRTGALAPGGSTSFGQVHRDFTPLAVTITDDNSPFFPYPNNTCVDRR
jgi:hypothetical protein